MKKSVYYLLLLLLMGTGSARAQVTTMGTDFWAGFMMNYKDTVSDNFFMISAFRDCSVQITSSDGSYDTLVNVTADAPLNVHIPFDYCNTLMDFGGITNKSLHVVATDTISLYAGSFLSASFDMTGVLPIPALGSGYILQTYESLYDSYFANFGAEFLVVATEDSVSEKFAEAAEEAAETVEEKAEEVVEEAKKTAKKAKKAAEEAVEEVKE